MLATLPACVTTITSPPRCVTAGTMGLLPVTSADWFHMLSIPTPVEYSAGGLY